MKLTVVATMISMIITLSAFGGDPDNYHEPKPSEYADSWDLGVFNIDATWDVVYSALRVVNNRNQSEDACKGYGTYTDECSAIMYVAREIDNNGGKFCLTQVQAGNKDTRHYTWIDYYNPKETHCVYLCKNGNCKEERTCNENDINFLQKEVDKDGGLTNEKYVNTTKSSEPFTTEMQVLDFKNEISGNGPNTRQGWHYLLAITKLLSHGAVVAPVKVIAERSGADGTDFAWIKAIMKSDQETLLCENGYIPNDAGTDCIQGPQCEINKPRCTGYEGGFDETIHEIYKESDSATCTKYHCKGENQGFKSETDRSCITCGETIKSGVKKDGICLQCSKSQYFKDENCVSATEISTLQMKNGKNYETEDRKCWKYNDAETFANCVTENAQDWQRTLDAIKTNQ